MTNSSEHPQISAIILANQSDDWLRSLQSLRAQSLRPDEILVVGEPSVVSSSPATSDGYRTIGVSPATPPSERLNIAMAETRGAWIVLTMASDESHRDRVRLTIEPWRNDGAHVVASGPRRESTARGDDLDLATFCAHGTNRCCEPATLSWHRSVFDTFGPLDSAKSRQRFESVIVLRGLLSGGCAYIDQPLVKSPPRPLSERLPIGIEAEIRAESLRAQQVEQTLYLLETLASFRQRFPDQRDLRDGEASLAGVALSQIADWVRHRNRLMLFGYRAGWQEAEESALQTGKRQGADGHAIAIGHQ